MLITETATFSRYRTILSKYCIYEAIPDVSATTIAHALAIHLFAVYGAQKCILTDRGKSFPFNVKHYATSYDDWDRLLPYAMFVYNIPVYEATNFTPYELVVGRSARTPTSFLTEEKFETCGSYLGELVTRLFELRQISAENIIASKHRSK